METGGDYPTCEKTFATLRVFPGEGVVPEDVTARLGVQPDRVQHQGEIKRPGGKPVRVNGWFLSSEGRLDSLDSRNHIHWLLDQLEPCKGELKALADGGSKIDIFVRWDSAQGHGGPTHDVKLSKRLVDFDLELGYDVYVGW